MKKITIEGKTFEYKVLEIFDGPRYHTKFYFPGETEKVIRYKYLFWGKYTTIEPKEAFTVCDFNIENPIYSKDEVKKRIMKKLSIILRREEIEKGELI